MRSTLSARHSVVVVTAFAVALTAQPTALAAEPPPETSPVSEPEGVNTARSRACAARHGADPGFRPPRLRRLQQPRPHSRWQPGPMEGRPARIPPCVVPPGAVVGAPVSAIAGDWSLGARIGLAATGAFQITGLVLGIVGAVKARRSASPRVGASPTGLTLRF